MSSAEDLLDHFKLDAEYRNDGEFHNGYSLHTSYISDHARGKRKEKVETKWFRQRIIGEGSFGQVWLEVQYKGEAILRKRALKVLEKRRLRLFDIDYKKELLALAKFSKSQYRQAEVIVKFHGWFEDSQNVYLGMEFFQLGDLDQYIATTIPEHGIKEITADLLEGLSIMHNEGFTHRDLKPKNIFVVQKPPSARKWWVKIGDFGITKRIDNEHTALRTQTGTFYFQAPEINGYVDIERQTSEYSNAVDIWSLGCVLYNVSAKKIPFAKGGDLRRFCNKDTPFPREDLSASLSDEGVKFVECLMNPQPSLRWNVEDALRAPWLQTPYDGSESLEKSPIDTGRRLTSDAEQAVFQWDRAKIDTKEERLMTWPSRPASLHSLSYIPVVELSDPADVIERSRNFPKGSRSEVITVASDAFRREAYGMLE